MGHRGTGIIICGQRPLLFRAGRRGCGLRESAAMPLTVFSAGAGGWRNAEKQKQKVLKNGLHQIHSGIMAVSEVGATGKVVGDEFP